MLDICTVGSPPALNENETVPAAGVPRRLRTAVFDPLTLERAHGSPGAALGALEADGRAAPVLVLVWLACVLGLAMWARQRWPDQPEWSRKLLHIGSGPVVDCPSDSSTTTPAS